MLATSRISARRWAPPAFFVITATYCLALAWKLRSLGTADPDPLDVSASYRGTATLLAAGAVVAVVAAISLVPDESGTRLYRRSRVFRRGAYALVGCLFTSFVFLGFAMAAVALNDELVAPQRPGWRERSVATSPDGRFEAAWLIKWSIFVPDDGSQFGTGEERDLETGVVLRDLRSPRRMVPWPTQDRVVVYFQNGYPGTLAWEDATTLIVVLPEESWNEVQYVHDWRGVLVRVEEPDG